MELDFLEVFAKHLVEIVDERPKHADANREEDQQTCGRYRSGIPEHQPGTEGAGVSKEVVAEHRGELGLVGGARGIQEASVQLILALLTSPSPSSPSANTRGR